MSRESGVGSQESGVKRPDIPSFLLLFVGQRLFN